MRAVLLYALIAGSASAQNPPPDSLAPLEQAVLKATTDWQVLAKDLEGRVARMLPCDPRSKAALEEVSAASQARLAALGRYYSAAQSLAESRSEGANRLLTAETSHANDVVADRVHGEEVLAILQTAIADLAEGARVQPALEGARAALQQTADLVKQRLQLARDQAERRDAVMDSLKALATAYRTRETAVKQANTAFETERARWNAYYTARSARAQTECALTGGPAAGGQGASGPAPSAAPPAAPKPAPRPAVEGKQK